MTRLSLLFGLTCLGLLAWAPSTLAQGNAFTYHGRLTDNGSVATGNYNILFQLYDAAAGGSQIGGTLSLSPVPVSSGLFMVSLDFGVGAFPGASRWLQIGVRTNGSSGAFTPLNPRQALSATPYAVTAGDVTAPNIARLNVPNTATVATGVPVLSFGFIVNATLTSGGVGYLTTPTVTVNDSTGSGAIITATISNGTVVSLTVQNTGSGYSAGATLTIGAPPSNAFQTFPGVNYFTGVNTLNNANNTFAGTFSGNGAGLTGLGGGGIVAGSIPGTALANNAVTAAKIASGQVVKSLNGLTDAVTLAAGANVTLSTNGNSLQISTAAGGLALPYNGSVSANNVAAIEAYNTHTNGAGLYGKGSLYGVEGVTYGATGIGVVGMGQGNSSYGTFGQHVPSGNYGALGLNYAGVYGQYTPNGNYGELGTATRGVYGEGNGSGSDAMLGIHTPSGNVGVLASPTFGTYGAHAATGNYGYLGVAADGVEGYGNNLSSSGVFGRNVPTFNYGGLGSPTAGAFGVYGNFGTSGQLGTANYGAYGIHNAAQNDGRLGDIIAGVRGVAAAANSTSAGVRGEHSTSGNFGQLGNASYGVVGLNFAAGEFTAGVRGAHNPSGAFGLLGTTIQDPLAGAIGIGVYGSANNPGWAGYFEGNALVSHGSLTVSRSFPFNNMGAACTFVRNGTAGAIVWFYGPDGFAGDISVLGGTVFYNAFSGAHYGWTDEEIASGALVSLTGTNRWVGEERRSEIIYGVRATLNANDSKCLGSYGGRHNLPTDTREKLTHLITAVGNGDMWVSDGGNGNLEPGNYLISSDIPGCAMRDNLERFPIGYICARAAEGVKWSEIAADANGVKRKKISVLFESFERHSGSAALSAELHEQKTELRQLRETVARLETLVQRVGHVSIAASQQPRKAGE